MLQLRASNKPLSSLILPSYLSIFIPVAQPITFSSSSFLWLASLSTAHLSKSVFSLTTSDKSWLLSIPNAPLQILILLRLMSSYPLLMPSALSSGFLMPISVDTDSHIFKSANARAQKHIFVSFYIKQIGITRAKSRSQTWGWLLSLI